MVTHIQFVCSLSRQRPNTCKTQRTVVETVSIPTHVARSQKAPSSLLPGTFIMYIPLVIVGHRQTPWERGYTVILSTITGTWSSLV